MRGCLWIAQDVAAEPHYLDFIEATFAAYFTREEDISQDEVLAAICRQTGINADAFLAGIARPDIKEQLKVNTDAAIRRGAFGSPTFFVGDDMYFGNDRLALVRSAVLRSKAKA
jgi:2-hydroxychromene-2-carboxylate isomerase